VRRSGQRTAAGHDREHVSPIASRWTIAARIAALCVLDVVPTVEVVWNRMNMQGALLAFHWQLLPSQNRCLNG
jgi:hypothetical protein